MKTKILSYLFGGLLFFSMGFMFSYVNAQQSGFDETFCKRSPDDERCKARNESMQQASSGKVCSGIKLNTDFPIVGNCIELNKGGTGTNTLNAFSTMVGSLIRIVTSIILIVCFALIILAGIKRSSNDPKGARDLIKKVAITILLLGLSGVILRVINPTFFS